MRSLVVEIFAVEGCMRQEWGSRQPYQVTAAATTPLNIRATTSSRPNQLILMPLESAQLVLNFASRNWIDETIDCGDAGILTMRLVRLMRLMWLQACHFNCHFDFKATHHHQFSSDSIDFCTAGMPSIDSTFHVANSSWWRCWLWWCVESQFWWGIGLRLFFPRGDDLPKLGDDIPFAKRLAKWARLNCDFFDFKLVRHH